MKQSPRQTQSQIGTLISSLKEVRFSFRGLAGAPSSKVNGDVYFVNSIFLVGVDGIESSNPIYVGFTTLIWLQTKKASEITMAKAMMNLCDLLSQM